MKKWFAYCFRTQDNSIEEKFEKLWKYFNSQNIKFSKIEKRYSKFNNEKFKKLTKINENENESKNFSEDDDDQISWNIDLFCDGTVHPISSVFENRFNFFVFFSSRNAFLDNRNQKFSIKGNDY